MLTMSEHISFCYQSLCTIMKENNFFATHDGKYSNGRANSIRNSNKQNFEKSLKPIF